MTLIKCSDKWIAALFCLLSVLIADLQISAMGAPQNVSALKLEQTHCTLGNVEVLINSQAVKIFIKKSDTVLIARAPAWKVMWYRKDTKTAYELPFDSWHKFGSKLVPLGSFASRSFTRESVTKVNGEHVVKLHSGEGKKLLDFWVVEDAPAAAQGCDVIVSFFRLPLAKGVPYRCKVTYGDHEESTKTSVSWIKNSSLFEKEEGTRLDTAKISRVTVPSAEFDYPQNYKMVKNEQQVWLTSGAREAMDDLFNMPTLEYKK
jgi:hypothetical protein